MLQRASERMAHVNTGTITVIAEDFRTAQSEQGTFDVILAAAILHHLEYAPRES